MHKITPLLLPELQLLKLHSKSKKLGTNFFLFFLFFLFGDLIQSKKTSWQLAQTQKQPATQLRKEASLKIYQTSLCFFLSLRLSLSKGKAPNPNTKVPSKFPRLFSFCKLFLLCFFLCNVHGSFSHCHSEEVDEHHRLLIWREKKTTKKSIQNKTKTQTQTQKKKKKTILTNSTTQLKCWQIEQPPNKEREQWGWRATQDFWEKQ
jgi:hypothetical protein